ncbi:Uncharacterized protein Fot_12527 [Forsythia ovata]|uniref:Reverse transcriptase zinc-binding domain-containing protein n=1 Tax=Forsythia ovata TaxID=205694 RepID=A0ABD1WN71_9LAMI
MAETCNCLARRKISMTSVCPWCDLEQSNMHVFFHCPSNKQLWWVAWLWVVVRQGVGASVEDTVLNLFHRTSREEFMLVGNLLWVIWGERKRILHGGKERVEGRSL